MKTSLPLAAEAALAYGAACARWGRALVRDDSLVRADREREAARDFMLAATIEGRDAAVPIRSLAPDAGAPS